MRRWLPVRVTSTHTRGATPTILTSPGDDSDVTRGSRIWLGTTAPSRAFGRVLYIQNKGTVDLTFRDLRVTGTGFGLVSPPKRTTLKPGASVAFRVRLLASTVGEYKGSVELNSNDPNGPFKVFLYSHVEAKSALLSVTQGTTKTYNGGTYDASSQLRFSVRNLGTAPRSFGPVRVPEGFSVLLQLPPSLGGGQTADFVVSRDSASPVSPDNVISFETSDPDKPTAPSPPRPRSRPGCT